MATIASGTTGALKRSAWGSTMALARPWGMPVRPPSSCDSPWCTPIAGVLEGAAGQRGGRQQVGAGGEVGRVVDAPAGRASCSRHAPARAMASASGERWMA